jgi:hypothetical protein
MVSIRGARGPRSHLHSLAQGPGSFPPLSSFHLSNPVKSLPCRDLHKVPPRLLPDSHYASVVVLVMLLERANGRTLFTVQMLLLTGLHQASSPEPKARKGPGWQG